MDRFRLNQPPAKLHKAPIDLINLTGTAWVTFYLLELPGSAGFFCAVQRRGRSDRPARNRYFIDRTRSVSWPLRLYLAEFCPCLTGIGRQILLRWWMPLVELFADGG